MLPKLKIFFEKWKWNEEYQVYVSTEGNFRNKEKQPLKCCFRKGGYLALWTHKGFVAAHRLVMITWRPIPNAAKMTVDHIDHNKRYNALRNLEWVTHEENMSRAKEDNKFAVPHEKSLSVNGVTLLFSDAVKILQSVAHAGMTEEQVAVKLRECLNERRRKIFGMEIKYVEN